MSDALPPLFGRADLSERIAKAKDHMHGYRQHNEALWPHQSFVMTLGELLDAAERGLKTSDEIERLRAEVFVLRDANARWQKLSASAPAPAEPVAWQWRKKGEPWSLDKTFNRQVYATTPDSEVRPLYAAPAAPAGWQLVPVEPTPEMAKAGCYRYCKEFVKDYKAMIAAAPTDVGQHG